MNRMFQFSLLLNKAESAARLRLRSDRISATATPHARLADADGLASATASTTSPEQARRELDEQMQRLGDLLDRVESLEFDREAAASEIFSVPPGSPPRISPISVQDDAPRDKDDDDAELVLEEPPVTIELMRPVRAACELKLTSGVFSDSAQVPVAAEGKMLHDNNGVCEPKRVVAIRKAGVPEPRVVVPFVVSRTAGVVQDFRMAIKLRATAADDATLPTVAEVDRAPRPTLLNSQLTEAIHEPSSPEQASASVAPPARVISVPLAAHSVQIFAQASAELPGNIQTILTSISADPSQLDTLAVPQFELRAMHAAPAPSMREVAAATEAVARDTAAVPEVVVREAAANEIPAAHAVATAPPCVSLPPQPKSAAVEPQPIGPRRFMNVAPIYGRVATAGPAAAAHVWLDARTLNVMAAIGGLLTLAALWAIASDLASIL